MRSTFYGGLDRFFPPAVERREPDAATQAWLKRCKRREDERNARRARLKALRQPHDPTPVQAALDQIDALRARPR